MISARFCTSAEALTILKDPEIYDRITDDNCPTLQDFVLPDRVRVHYIGGYVGGTLAALSVIHHDNKFHFMVLEPYRRHARELLKQSLSLWPVKVWCEIPACYRTVINFARRNGFVELGIIPKAHRKNGQIYDIHIMRN